MGEIGVGDCIACPFLLRRWRSQATSLWHFRAVLRPIVAIEMVESLGAANDPLWTLETAPLLEMRTQ